MSTTRISRRIVTAALITSPLTVAGCSTGSHDAAVDPNAPVTISVGNKPLAENPEQVKVFERTLKQFREAHPNITINAEETRWEADTFTALLAGGKLPTVMGVPFTEMGGLISREQVADVTDYVKAMPILAKINPNVTKVVQSTEGRMFGVPVEAYTMGLLYNRGLFKQAGLDPDAPPRNWEQVRAAAKIIKDKTRTQGFATMTLDNTGGWILTATSYAFGSKLESEDGKQATVANDATRKVLEFYRTLRWQDNTMGSNFLLNYDDAVKAFAGGKIGMFVQGADNYTNMVINQGMKPDDFGVAPLPQAAGGIGTLGGGGVQIFNLKATPAQIVAALKWIEFSLFAKFSDEKVAKEQAAAEAKDGGAIGAPGLPILNKETNERYLSWIASYINVPRHNYKLYLDTVEQLPLVPEPPVKAQELYGALDPVVQGVLTRKDAKIDELLGKAQRAVQASLDAS